MRLRTIFVGSVVGGALLFPAAANGGPLPDNCVKNRGTVTCVTFDGPGKNQAGVGVTTTKETKGNTKNTSPEPQDLESSETCKPPKSQGRPCNP